MTTQEKDLLLQDISGRLKYGVKCALCGRWEKENGGNFNGYYTLHAVATDKTWLDADNYPCLCSFEGVSTPMDLTELKPYLRPMDYMTEEEIKEFTKLIFISDSTSYGYLKECVLYSMYTSKAIDWLNKNHFDYRDLIPMGLAIAVTKENNPYENNNN